MHLVDVAGRANHEDILRKARVPELFGVGNLSHAEGVDPCVPADGGQRHEAETVSVSLDNGEEAGFSGALFERLEVLTDGGGIYKVTFHARAPLFAATETMFYALQQYGIKTGLNEDVINKVNDFFKPVKQKYVDSGRINAKSMATDAQALVYKVPGGMLSNMIANLTDMKAMDKFEAALAEIPAVRKDLGYPPLVTPLSQMVGNQAVTNVLLGQRYKQVSKEVKNYFKGEYGIAPAPVSKELETQILGEGGKPVDCRIEDAKRTGEDFKKAKEALGDLARSEEDIMSYICYPDQTMKFLTDRKAKEENICKYSIVEA